MSTDTALCILDAMYNSHQKESYEDLRNAIGFCEFRDKITDLAKILDDSYDNVTQQFENPGIPWDYEVVPALLDELYEFGTDFWNPPVKECEKIIYQIFREWIEDSNSSFTLAS